MHVNKAFTQEIVYTVERIPITFCTFYKLFFLCRNYSNTSICNYSLVWVSSWNITWQSRSQTPWSKCLSLQYLPVRHIQEPAWFCLAKQVLTFLGIKMPNFCQQVLNTQVLISGCLFYFVKVQLPQINVKLSTCCVGNTRFDKG